MWYEGDLGRWGGYVVLQPNPPCEEDLQIARSILPLGDSFHEGHLTAFPAVLEIKQAWGAQKFSTDIRDSNVFGVLKQVLDRVVVVREMFAFMKSFFVFAMTGSFFFVITFLRFHERYEENVQVNIHKVDLAVFISLDVSIT